MEGELSQIWAQIPIVHALSESSEYLGIPGALHGAEHQRVHALLPKRGRNRWISTGHDDALFGSEKAIYPHRFKHGFVLVLKPGMNKRLACEWAQSQIWLKHPFYDFLATEGVLFQIVVNSRQITGLILEESSFPVVGGEQIFQGKEVEENYTCAKNIWLEAKALLL